MPVFRPGTAAQELQGVLFIGRPGTGIREDMVCLRIASHASADALRLIEGTRLKRVKAAYKSKGRSYIIVF